MRALLATLAVAVILTGCAGDESPEDATLAQLRMLVAGQDARLWDALHPAQQALLDRDEFMRCTRQIRNSGRPVPADVEMTVVDTYDDEILIPGTDVHTEAVAVSVRFEHDGESMVNTTRVIDVDGEWTWTLVDPESRQNC